MTHTSSPKGTVCVIGIWHLGIVNAVGFAHAGYTVVGIEPDRAKAQQLNRGVPPIFEPGLKEAMSRHLDSGRLRFVSEYDVTAQADYVVVAFDSPVDEQDRIDVSPVVSAARAAAPFLKANTPLVITSQISAGTSRVLQSEISQLNPNWKSGVVYTPENLRLGNALERFLRPDMLVLGADSPQARDHALSLYEPIDSEKVFMDLTSAELVKHALNGFLAMSITFINEIAKIADRLGADAVAVGHALKLDKRIGPRALMMPGLGFSGGTLARDVVQLQTFGIELDCNPHLWDTIRQVNQETFDEVTIKLCHHLGNLKGKTIAVLGLTYKPGTSTMRRSPSITLMRNFTSGGAICRAFDPMASVEESAEYADLFARADNVGQLAAGADALVLVTEWPEFRNLDFTKLASSMRKPLIIDTKNYLDPNSLAEVGFIYQGFGRKARAC